MKEEFILVINPCVSSLECGPGTSGWKYVVRILGKDEKGPGPGRCSKGKLLGSVLGSFPPGFCCRVPS